MTNKINFSQVIKNKKIWAVAAVIVGVAAVADSMGSEYANHYESNYGYPQGQVNPYPTGGNYYPHSGGAYPMNPGSYPMPSAQPAMQPNRNSGVNMDAWRKNNAINDANHRNYIEGIWE